MYDIVEGNVTVLPCESSEDGVLYFNLVSSNRVRPRRSLTLTGLTFLNPTTGCDTLSLTPSMLIITLCFVCLCYGTRTIDCELRIFAKQIKMIDFITHQLYYTLLNLHIHCKLLFVAEYNNDNILFCTRYQCLRS